MEFLNFQISSIIYILLLAVMYFSKKRIDNIDNKIFSLLIITNIIGLFFDIISTLLIANDINNLFAIIIAKVYLLYLVTWLLLFTIYIILVSNETLKFNFKQLWIKLLLTIFTIVSIIILLVPLYPFNDGKLIYTYGPGVTLTYIYAGISSVIWIFCLLQNRKNINNKKYIPLLALAFIGFLAGVVQFVSPSSLIITFIFVFITFLMYFTIENPDVKVINQLNYAKISAEKANKAKTDFLSNMSHEIRTPLNAIVGFSDCIKDAKNLNEAKENAKDIVTASDTLLEIVNSILDISKIEAGKMEIINTNYDAPEVFNGIVKLAQARLGEKDLDFQINICDDLPKVLYGDHSNLRKVVINLLTNAIKYTESGFMKFTVSCIKKNNICRLIISVEDSGRGIKTEDIDRLFNKFERIEEDRNTTLEGTGLGLAITKQLVEMLGGKIVVQSVYGQGSKFTVSIDQKIESSDVVLTKSIEDVKIENLSKYSVLIVDDNLLNIKVATKIMSPYKLNIESVISGDECIKLITSGKKYDLILMDDMMPKKNGTETFHELQEIKGFDTPVVSLTANALTGIREKFLKEGFQDYLSKPIDKSELNRVLLNFLKNK